jgi:hypothetical protein
LGARPTERVDRAFPASTRRIPATVCPVWHAHCFEKTNQLSFFPERTVVVPLGLEGSLGAKSMLANNETLLFLFALAVLVVGVACTVTTRLSQRPWARAFSQRVFVICLVAIGLATVHALRIGCANWLACATTLSVISVVATLDVKPRQHAPQF